ncbi:MAG: tetratricopeptide repeat protein [Blastocatellia bacterium]
MQIKNLMAALVVSALFAISALAQTGRIEFDLKNDKGEPVVGAKVEIVRTDIKGNYEAQGDKKGHYLHAGVPFVGRYTILISAPGYAPTYLSDVKPDQPISPVVLNAGDGSKLTMDQVKQAQTAAKQGGGQQKQMTEAEYKKQKEEYEKKKKEIDDYKAKFEEMKKHFEAGQAALAKNDYATAATEYREAANLNPDPNDQNQTVFLGNLAIALFNSGVTKINGGQRDEAKQDFVDSATAADKALTTLKGLMSDPAKANDPALKKNLAAFTKSKADANYILATKYGDGAAADTAAVTYKEAAALTEDPAAKKTMMVKSAKTYFESGKSEQAITAYQEILQGDPENLDALYELGLAYAGAGKFQESANTLQKFLDKAPPTNPHVEEVKVVIKDLVVGNNLQPPKSEKGGSKSTTKKKP